MTCKGDMERGEGFMQIYLKFWNAIKDKIQEKDGQRDNVTHFQIEDTSPMCHDETAENQRKWKPFQKQAVIKHRMPQGWLLTLQGKGALRNSPSSMGWEVQLSDSDKHQW